MQRDFVTLPKVALTSSDFYVNKICCDHSFQA